MAVEVDLLDAALWVPNDPAAWGFAPTFVFSGVGSSWDTFDFNSTLLSRGNYGNPPDPVYNGRTLTAVIKLVGLEVLAPFDSPVPPPQVGLVGVGVEASSYSGWYAAGFAPIEVGATATVTLTVPDDPFFISSGYVWRGLMFGFFPEQAMPPEGAPQPAEFFQFDYSYQLAFELIELYIGTPSEKPLPPFWTSFNLTYEIP